MMTTEELKKIGVNPENMTKKGYEDIIVQCFEVEDDRIKEDDLVVYPDIFQPKRNKVYSCAEYMDGYNLNNKIEKEKYLKMLKDSAERLKIISHLLTKQAQEIEEFGYPVTRCSFVEY